MSAFGSSAINKSTRKFAPKAPIARRRPVETPSESQPTVPDAAIAHATVNQSAEPERLINDINQSTSQTPTTSQPAQITIIPSQQEVHNTISPPDLSDTSTPVQHPISSNALEPLPSFAPQVPSLATKVTQNQLGGARPTSPKNNAEHGYSEGNSTQQRAEPIQPTVESQPTISTIPSIALNTPPPTQHESRSTGLINQRRQDNATLPPSVGTSITNNASSSQFPTQPQILLNGNSDRVASILVPAQTIEAVGINNGNDQSNEVEALSKISAVATDASILPGGKKPRKPRSDKGKARKPRNGTVAEPSATTDQVGEDAPTPAKRQKKTADKAQTEGSGQTTSAEAQPKKRKRAIKSKKTTDDQSTPLEGEAEVSIAPKRKRARKNASSTSVDGETTEGADGNNEGQQAVRRRGRKRAVTPENASDVEIVPGTVAMSELCRDTRTGKMSARERAMREIDWDQVARRRKEQQIAQATAGTNNQAEIDERLEEAARQRSSTQQRGGPELREINGQIVVIQESLLIDRHKEATRDEDELEEIEEDDLTNRINTSTWVLANRRDPADRVRWNPANERWSVVETAAFYDALRMFGTDFNIISHMFPGKSRRMVKAKFVKEERTNGHLVHAALMGEKVPMDFEIYLEKSGRDRDSFKDPRALEEELREEDEKQRSEIERQRKEHAEIQRQKRFAEGGDETGDGAPGESTKENDGGKKGKNKKKRAKDHAVGGDEVEVVGHFDAEGNYIED